MTGMLELAARVGFAAAIVRAWICYRLVMLLPLGDVGSWRWKLLPYAGDWAYAFEEDGYLASFAAYRESRAALRSIASMKEGGV